MLRVGRTRAVWYHMVLKEELTFCEVQDEGRDRKALEDAIRTHLFDFEGRAYAKNLPSSD